MQYNEYYTVSTTIQIYYATNSFEASYKLLRDTIHVIHDKNNKH